MTPRLALWERPDAEIWAEVDAAWVLEQFRRSEVSEARAHQRALAAAVPLEHRVAQLAVLIAQCAAEVMTVLRIAGRPDVFAAPQVPAPARAPGRRTPRRARPTADTLRPAPARAVYARGWLSVLTRRALRDRQAVLTRLPLRTPATRRTS
jgi:hypothetical protein